MSPRMPKKPVLGYTHTYRNKTASEWFDVAMTYLTKWHRESKRLKAKQAKSRKS